MKKRAGIIGAGIGGLASAIRLALKGRQVTVFERGGQAGGKLSEFRKDGFRFDAGPSLLTLPHLIDELFREAGKEPDAVFRYTKLDLITKYFFSDGSVLNAWSDPDRFSREVEEKLGVPTRLVRSYLEASKSLFERTADLFLFSPFRLKDLVNHPGAREIARSPLSLLAHKSLHRHNQMLGDPRLIQLFDRYATYNGSNPFKAPATLSIIPHLEHSMGAYYPEGGMFQVASSLFGLAKDLGVEFHFNLAANTIRHHHRVTGIDIGDHTIPFDEVVVNADVRHAYDHLLPGLSFGWLRKKQEPSTSALIFYWGIANVFPELDLHNIFFSGDYQREFGAIDQGKIDHDPTIYVYISSKMVSGDAPTGKENWFTMINVPYDSGQDWDRLIAEARDAILKKLSRMLGKDISSLIESEQILDPRGIAYRTSSFGGALYGPSSNSPVSAFLRHPNRHPSVQNLYFVGGSVHPGGGIPLVLASAKIMSAYVE